MCATPPIAWAESPTMDGVYHYADEDGAVGTWIIRTTCTPDCVAHVTTAPGRGFDAPLIDGRYTVTLTGPAADTRPGASVEGCNLYGGSTHASPRVQSV